MWTNWKDLEPDEGVYDFDQLLANIDEAERRGWMVGLRIMTSVTRKAPGYLGPLRTNGSAGYKITPHDTGRMVNYDPADPIFHARYLAFVAAVGAAGICRRDVVKLLYVGYASSSNGDEGIGPHGHDCSPEACLAPEAYPHVIDRLNAWQAACAGNEWKMIMGGPSSYGISLGFGVRNGFVEHYLYEIPHATLGQVWGADNSYLSVNETAPVFSPRSVAIGDENEEYGRKWASDYRTYSPSQMGGGTENLSAPEQGSVARFGPLASFQYRYFMSTLRSMQMRISTLLVNTFALNGPLASYLALELGRTAQDAPDAWCFLMEAQLRRGPLKNFERWLYQRDTAEAPTVADARITQTPAEPSPRTWMTTDKHDWIARAAENGIIDFQLDGAFLASRGDYASIPYVVKVTFFDVVGHGSVVVTTRAAGILGAPQPTTGDGTLKTATFEVGHAFSLDSPAFQIRGLNNESELQEIVVSFVRVVRDTPRAGAAPASIS
jgi:hypothetical protein